MNHYLFSPENKITPSLESAGLQHGEADAPKGLGSGPNKPLMRNDNANECGPCHGIAPQNFSSVAHGGVPSSPARNGGSMIPAAVSPESISSTWRKFRVRLNKARHCSPLSGKTLINGEAEVVQDALKPNHGLTTSCHEGSSPSVLNSSEESIQERGGFFEWLVFHAAAVWAVMFRRAIK